MRFEQRVWACFRPLTALTLSACLFASGPRVSASEQGQPPAGASAQPPAGTSPQTPGASQPAGQTLRIGQDEAVRMALENNLGVQAERLNPQIQEFGVAGALAAYTPELVGSLARSSNTAPPTEFLQTGVSVTTSTNFVSDAGVRQALPWGGNYQVGLSGSRFTTDAPRSVFSPQLDSDFVAIYNQPLLRGLFIDANRQAVLQSRNQQDVVDIQLQERITTTSRNVRNAYLNLVAAISGLDVARQSLEVAQQQLENNRRRVEVGTIAPIENVAAEAEVARTEEAVIVAEGQIESAQDLLRTLVMNPSQPDFWSVRLEPAEQPVLTPRPIDVDTAISNALANRTDMEQLRKELESTDLDIRFNRSAKLPALDLQARYGMTGVGGTQNIYGSAPIDGGPPPIETTLQRSFGDVLQDVFGNDFNNWSISLNVSYPIGTSAADAALAQSRLRRQQGQVAMRDLELEIARQVRQAARQVQTSLKRVESTQKARELAERQLEAEEKRVAVGLSDTFRSVQAQRDLADQRRAELNAIIDYNRALIDFEVVQLVPVR
jgi:outer membrane protein TolC